MRLSDYAPIASAIRVLVIHHPETLLRVTKNGPWGLMRIALTDTLALSLPGCLGFLATSDPSTIPNSSRIEAGTLARALADQLTLKQHSDSLLVSITVDGQRFPSCCLVDGKGISWVYQRPDVAPDGDHTLEIPPIDERPVMRESSLFSLPFLAAPVPVPSLAAFRDVTGDEPGAVFAPAAEREARRTTWLMRNLRAEQSRLHLYGIDEPAWLTDALLAVAPRPAVTPRARQL